VNFSPPYLHGPSHPPELLLTSPSRPLPFPHNNISLQLTSPSWPLPPPSTPLLLTIMALTNIPPHPYTHQHADFLALLMCYQLDDFIAVEVGCLLSVPIKNLMRQLYNVCCPWSGDQFFPPMFI
jgi:hypothetical protein